MGTKVAMLRTRTIDTGPGGDSDPVRVLATLQFGAGRDAALRGLEDTAVTAHRTL